MSIEKLQQDLNKVIEQHNELINREREFKDAAETAKAERLKLQGRAEVLGEFIRDVQATEAVEEVADGPIEGLLASQAVDDDPVEDEPPVDKK